MTDEFSDNPLIGAIRDLKKGVRFLKAINEPTEPADYIWKYGVLSFNTQTGLFVYGNKKPIPMNENQRPYKIMYALFQSPGTEVLYPKLAAKIDQPYKGSKERRRTREKIRQVFKQIRRNYGINALKNPELNPFVMSGKGVKLALIF